MGRIPDILRNGERERERERERGSRRIIYRQTVGERGREKKKKENNI